MPCNFDQLDLPDPDDASLSLVCQCPTCTAALTVNESCSKLAHYREFLQKIPAKDTTIFETMKMSLLEDQRGTFSPFDSLYSVRTWNVLGIRVCARLFKHITGLGKRKYQKPKKAARLGLPVPKDERTVAPRKVRAAPQTDLADGFFNYVYENMCWDLAEAKRNLELDDNELPDDTREHADSNTDTEDDVEMIHERWLVNDNPHGPTLQGKKPVTRFLGGTLA